jgi:hypothetical protein
MRKIFLLAFMVLAVSTVVFAQDFGPRGRNRHPWQSFERQTDMVGEELTLNGRLEWADGRIAVITEDKTYFVTGIKQLLGLVDGLKEGAQLTLTGRAYGVSYIPEYGFFRAEKLSFNGKDYTLNQNRPGFGGPMHQGRHGGGMMRGGW